MDTNYLWNVILLCQTQASFHGCEVAVRHGMSAQWQASWCVYIYYGRFLGFYRAIACLGVDTLCRWGIWSVEFREVEDFGALTGEGYSQATEDNPEDFYNR